MINYDERRLIVAKGLSKYLNCSVVRSNQNAEPPPYPYVSYGITIVMSSYNGTYGEYEDGTLRKPFTQTWSVSILSDDSSESVMLALKAREWFDRAGRTYLSDNDIIVQSVTSVTNRDNVLSVGYEYKNGFDVVFSLFDEITLDNEEPIETLNISEVEHQPYDDEEMVERLEKRLDGELYNEEPKSKLREIELIRESEEDLIALLENRLSGVE